MNVNDLHSIWLMPDPDSEDRFQAIVDELSDRFLTPRFRPHLTLAGDVDLPLADVCRIIRDVAAHRLPPVETVAAVVTSDLYFRSFYAEFRRTAPLLDLRRRTCDLIPAPGAPDTRLDDFVPHVSLLYGPVPDEPKEAARRAVMECLAGLTFRFDRVCAVRSADSIPIADWAVIDTADFSAA